MRAQARAIIRPHSPGFPPLHALQAFHESTHAMKATYIEQQGAPEVLTYGDLPDPSPSASEVVIRVRATALNHLDTFARAGRNGVIIDKFPHVLGCDLAGEVAELGAGVEGLRVGDRVMVDYSLPCGKCSFCVAGQDQLCRAGRSIGISVNGGYAQYVAVPSANAHVLPDSMDFEEAAAIPLVYKTAWHCLITRCGMQAGEDVLVMAAGSGVGSAAIRVAKMVGARVITTASTEEKLVKARALGADETINYVENPTYSATVREMTGGKGVDLVFDSIGGSVWDENFKSLRPGGRLVNCGVTGGHRASLRIGRMFTEQVTLMGASTGNRSDFLKVANLVRSGNIRGIVSRTFPLENAAEAHRAMEGRDVFGKLVLVVP